MKNKFVNINTRRMLWAASVLTALFFSACEVDDREDAAFSEMGVVKGVYEVSPEYGTLEMQIYSNHTCDVYPAETYDWATLMTNKVNGDGSVTVEFQENYSFRRQAKFYVYAAESNRLDSIILRQRGAIDIILNSPTPNVKVYSQSGAVSVPFSTNVNKDDISISIFGETADEPSWVNHDFVLDDINHALNFTVGQNTSETDLRNARILMQYRDAWDSLFVYSIYLIQANAKDEFGQLITFQQARNWAGDKVSSYEYIEGYIISDAGNMNMGDNLQETDTKIDYTVNDKTAYIQSTDGQMGFMILTKDADDNHFLRYSKVQLLLKDATVEKMENPTRYVIRDVTSAMVLESQEGNYSNLPAKEKYMSELTDDDVYTYVTLKDCEFPVRKGSLTPYNEGYTTLFSAHRVNKYPLLMRDIQGNSMFLLTNTTCPYRRDGRMLPYGSGKISGVIVHETFPRFEYEGLGDENEESYGEIGRYEMRHVTREDIQFAEDFSNSFSALLTEYRWPLIKNGIAYPTWPNETGEGNNGTISVSQILTNPAAAIGRSSDFSDLGPCGNNSDGILNGNDGNTNPLGNGVILA
ncbi:MAG: hypothetical protein LBC40_08915, partial [Dysgonamonadaceae bacterium]|nr:hypothetical protein [Dysgonamonadaceae bacterium]